LKWRVEQSQIAVKEAQSDLLFLEEYQLAVETSRRKLESEVKDLTPISGDDIPSLLLYADQRIERLHQELFEKEQEVQEKIVAAVKRQKEIDAEIAEEQLQSEISRVQSDYNVDMERLVHRIRQEHESDMRERLHRQGSLYHKHAESLLSAQKDKLEKQFNTHFVLQKQHESAQRQAVLNVTVAKLHGVESVIEDLVKVQSDRCNRKEFYNSCQMLSKALDRENGEYSKPLQDELEIVKKSLMKLPVSHPLIWSALQSIPQQALENGVPLEDNLRSQFNSMQRACEHVALIGEDGGNILQYFVSYLYAVLQFKTRINADGTTVEPEDTMNTFRLLSLARYFVSHGNFESAARLINQLQGEPRRLAADWLADARLFLETKQAVSVLCSYGTLGEL
jgi:mitofilin